MGSELSFSGLVVQFFGWLYRQLFGGGKLKYRWCAVRPHEERRMYAEYPDAMIAGEFVDMLRNSPNLRGFYEQVTFDLLKLKSQHPDCDIYVHSLRVA